MDDSAMYRVGFMHYNEMCATCHGGPGISPDELSKGLFPTPPEFYKSDDMPQPAEAFWIIKNGIKFTANTVKIEFAAGIYHQAELTDVNGKVLQRLPLSTLDTEKIIDMSSMPSGIYFIKLAGNNGIESRKVVKE